MKYKRQHYVPASYLQSWCDPKCQPGQKPYVWIFSKDGFDIRRRSPQKTFFENDLYTIHSKDSERDLTLEYNLSRIENKFSKLRREKLVKHFILTFEEHIILCMFVAAMYGRTLSFASKTSEQWNKVLNLGKKMIEWAENASPQERERAASMNMAPIDEENFMTMEDVQEIIDHPLQSSLATIVTGITPVLFRIPFVIFEIPKPITHSFITSDAPCVWFDPAVYMQPRPRFAGGLVSPSIEITLPISPNQLLFFSKELLVHGSYMPLADKGMIDFINKRTRLSSFKYFISNSNTVRQEWF